MGIIFEEFFALILVSSVKFLFQVSKFYLDKYILIRYKLEKWQILIFQIDFFAFKPSHLLMAQHVEIKKKS
jgi:hypothetical protein